MAIHQEVTIKGSPEKIYKALTTADEFSQATGAPADIAAEEGRAFSCFGGQITGRNVEMSANKMIVQAWRAGAWPEGVYSIVRIGLDQAGDETKVTLDQSGFPDDAAEHLDGGWHKMYWDPLKAYFR
ncbi:MAG: SRPBCC family protein [Betaproteobacteria bacterium]